MTVMVPSKAGASVRDAVGPGDAGDALGQVLGRQREVDAAGRRRACPRPRRAPPRASARRRPPSSSPPEQPASSDARRPGRREAARAYDGGGRPRGGHAISLPHRRWRPPPGARATGHRRTAAIGWAAGHARSRRAGRSASGRSTGAPLAAAARAGAGAGPGDDQRVLALEEAVAADAAGGAALGGVLGERRHLDRARPRCRAARCEAPEAVTTTAVAGSRAPKNDDPLARRRA